MEVYAGIDLHSNTSYLASIDREDKRLYQNQSPNQADVILSKLEPWRESLQGVVVESTFNWYWYWYWLVDTLMDNDFKIPLANPAEIQNYTEG